MLCFFLIGSYCETDSYCVAQVSLQSNTRSFIPCLPEAGITGTPTESGSLWGSELCQVRGNYPICCQHLTSGWHLARFENLCLISPSLFLFLFPNVFLPSISSFCLYTKKHLSKGTFLLKKGGKCFTCGLGLLIKLVVGVSMLTLHVSWMFLFWSLCSWNLCVSF